ncbi:hypothetical protein BD311DRAFT_675374, partial [Dichomitus squalens]
ATSADAERAFSCGRLTVSRLRHSLNDELVHACTVLTSWAKIPGIVPTDCALELFRGRRDKNKSSKLVPDVEDEGLTTSSGADTSDVEILG